MDYSAVISYKLDIFLLSGLGWYIGLGLVMPFGLKGKQSSHEILGHWCVFGRGTFFLFIVSY